MREGPTGRSFLAFAPEAVRRIAWAFPAGPQVAVDRAERALGEVAWHDEVAVAHWMVRTPFQALVALALLADDPLSLAAERVRQVMPELWALSVPSKVTTYEHEPSHPDGRSTPLLDRVLRGLACAVEATRDLDADSVTLVTSVLLFSDVAKGGTGEQRAAWRTRLGVDAQVHNEDSAVILEDVIRRVLGKAELSEDGRWGERAKTLCAVSGLVGMRLRGEVGRDALQPFLDLASHEPDGGERLAKVWSIVNHCETQAVRRGLWTAELASAFAAEERAVLLMPGSHAVVRAQVSDRVARMRGGALLAREPVHEVEAALDRLGGARLVLESRLARCRIWYAEAALGALSLDGCVRLLLHLTGAAVASGGVDTTRPWHLDLLGVVGGLRDAQGAPRRYPVRLLETILDSSSTEALMSGRLEQDALVSFPSSKGGEQALAVELRTDPEAAALLTLVEIYEKKASAEFHRTLKALCDLYRLRKDDYDRVHNEAAYLVAMDAARTDKARMLDFVNPGLVLEVGPGGGVVLEMLAERFPKTRVVGVDASAAVIAAHEKRFAKEKAPYEMIHADAFELPKLFAPGEVTTVVFCSVLHEIFSYVAWGDPPARFRVEAVDAIVGAAFKALGRGGRIVVRDGVAPPADEPRIVEFVDPVWRRGLDLFRESFEPRSISFEPIGTDRVRIGTRDLYEFLTTFTWGPDSFPYEVREQRAVLPRAEYVARMIAACKKADPSADAREVPVPADLASYLQPGYPAHVSPHVRIFDESGEVPVSMPDVNGVWVIEKL